MCWRTFNHFKAFLFQPNSPFLILIANIFATIIICLIFLLLRSLFFCPGLCVCLMSILAAVNFLVRSVNEESANPIWWKADQRNHNSRSWWKWWTSPKTLKGRFPIEMSVEALGISLRQYKNVVSFVRSAVPNKFSHNESNFESKGSSWWQKVAIFSIFRSELSIFSF